ncbi:MAG: VWA domain-containing protein [Parvibaculum sp.]|uniref:vWA domain-containing protein n=1 Tax=Parvibaculum sp. TaxID=2024848 RepID=UPI001DF90879|nr:VWA domain-containing protein [Parvibaculum sp.]MBX3488431.1 VWA domain-containing protein [Parvibaculum sp.]MBX3496450.1 VWA domain-containing protein [Parvibaculum sp.]MCW5727589.1 VWA domain-containing protein [Parvibaculum sp.]
MFVHFFHELKKANVPVSLREYLTLLEAMDADVIERRVEDFYYLSRSALVKDERNLDKFDVVFGHVFKGLELVGDGEIANIPEEWLKALTEKFLTDEEKAQIEALGGWEKIMEELQKRLEEQKKRHEGGNKWIGTGGTSPFGANGYNPEGVRIGQKEGRHGKAVKVWDKREYKNLDDQVELGTRNIKVALRRLRRFAREGAPTELDLDGTIKATAHQGYLDLIMRPERRNKINVLIFFDIGGSMDSHIKLCEELFSAARTEFKNLEYFYFHNCLYEGVWKDNRRRHAEKMSTWDVLHKYPSDYKVIFVGDATMSPYEITYAGGSVEHWNEEPGGIWLERVNQIYESAIWINPIPERHWEYTPSLQIIKQIMGERMFPLTLEGLDHAMRELSR